MPMVDKDKEFRMFGRGPEMEERGRVSPEMPKGIKEVTPMENPHKAEPHIRL